MPIYQTPDRSLVWRIIRTDPAKLVTDYVPEVKGTVYEGATVRNLLDISVDDPEERAALKTSQGTAKEYEAVDEAGGWLPATATAAPDLRSYLWDDAILQR